MALPKIKHPIFELTVPSTKEQIKYRPFLVKEEKILLLAQQSKEVKEMKVALVADRQGRGKRRERAGL